MLLTPRIFGARFGRWLTADSFVQVPADGVGKKLDTWTVSDGDHREIVALGSGTSDDKIGADAANGLDVDVTRLPALPAGTNNIGDVDVLSIAAGDNNIGNVDVLTLPALPAGTNNIGDVDVITLPALPAGTNNIGDVDVLSIVPGTGATNQGKAVDSAAGATDTGVASLVVRDDALATLTPADGDYTNLRTDSTGALWVRDTSAAGGGTQYDEDTVSAAADKITMAGAVRKDTAATLVDTDGDRTQLQVDASGRLHVNASGVAVPVTDNAGSLTVDGSVSITGAIPAGANNIGDVDVLTLPALPAGTNNIGDVDVLTLPALPAGANNIGDVDVLTLPALVAGTANIGDVDVLTLPALVAGTANIGDVDIASGPTAGSALQVQGTAAHDAATVGNPVLGGAQMETMADSAPGTRSSTDGDVTKLATSDGALYVIPTGPQTWSYHADGSSALTDASVHAAPSAGLSLYVTDIVCSSGAATAMNIFFEEGASKVLGPYYLEAVAGRGLAIHFGTPKKITAATALTVTTSAAIAHAVDVTGFIAPG